MANRYSKKPNEHVNIAKEHINKYFKLAKEVFSKDQSLANRYIDLARKTAMKFKLKLEPSQKRSFCKHCYKFLMPGVNCRVRTQSGKVVYTCFSCKKFTRIPFK